jgi:hypothetical protein
MPAGHVTSLQRLDFSFVVGILMTLYQVPRSLSIEWEGD